MHLAIAILVADSGGVAFIVVFLAPAKIEVMAIASYFSISQVGSYTAMRDGQVKIFC